MPAPRIQLVDWGLLEYEESLARQHETVRARQNDECIDQLITVEHPHVFTLGRRRSARENILDAREVPIVEVERGGDVTYHGPGQIVLYAICKLQEGKRDLHRFLRNMEQGIIDTLQRYDLKAGREEGKTGVWIEGRKLASMGIACREWVTFHGLALNVNTDLSYFARINPCGFEASVMTSVQAELGGQPAPMTEMRNYLQRDVAMALGYSMNPPHHSPPA